MQWEKTGRVDTEKTIEVDRYYLGKDPATGRESICYFVRMHKIASGFMPFFWHFSPETGELGPVGGALFKDRGRIEEVTPPPEFDSEKVEQHRASLRQY